MNRRDEDVYLFLRDSLALELSIDVGMIQNDVPFVEMGMDSIIGVIWIRRINSHFMVSLPVTKVYTYPTLGAFQQYLLSITSDSAVEQIESIEGRSVKSELLAELKDSLAAELDLNTDFIDEDTPFTELGLDSIIGVIWIRKLNSKFKLSLSVTKVYNYPTISNFAEYLIREHSDVLAGVLANSQVAATINIASPEHISTGASTGNSAIGSTEKAQTTKAQATLASDIAIIGMSGSFPQAENLDEFWNNILEGKDCITEVPPSRWTVDEYYDPKPDKPGKTYSKWMGVLENADKFDPLFFNISPIEAEYMDPQQRLMLQESWRCIEDAGYEPFALSGSKCGVYVGCSPSGYGSNTELSDLTAHQNLGNNMAILASRISYFLNLRGPCLSIDTSCSSSLVAIASACDNLLLGNIDLALSGGVWVIPGPGLHVAMSQLGALSPDGRCYAFDSRANGFVPAEGVGVLMLKRLEDARRDRDHVYAVIKGWGVNQDGKSNGITAPNADAQADLQRSIYEKFNLNPEDIQLIETHGTGTSLGDPVEVDGLVSAFSGYTDKRQFCALTSVKSNIGHTACAAGVAGVIKAALAIKNKELPPAANFAALNPHIDFSETPFFVNEERKQWVQAEGLRHAAVSSFGYSGTNAHIVLSEAPDMGTDSPHKPENTHNLSYLIVLSARDEKRVEEQAKKLLSYIAQRPDAVIGNMSYTLLLGRKHFRYRLAVVVSDLSELSTELSKWLLKDAGSHVITGNANSLPLTNSHPESEAFHSCARVCRMGMGDAEYTSAFSTIAKLYIKGYNLPFEQLFDNGKYQRISLPTYPFVQQSYWLNHSIQPTTKQLHTPQEIRLHPVIHQDTSVEEGIRFTSIMGEDDFFLRDHKVGETMLLPGVVYIEMAREAIQRAMRMTGDTLQPSTESQIRLQNVIWLQPGALTGNELSMDVRVLPKSGDLYEYTIVGATGNEQEVVYNQGIGRLVAQTSPTLMDIAGLARTYSNRVISSQEFYDIYNNIGLNYGPSHQAVVELSVGLGKDSLPGVLVKLENPRGGDEHDSGFVLHPSIMDGALQATMAMGFASIGTTGFDSKARVPFSFETLDIYQPTPNQAYAWIRYSTSGFRNRSNQKLDISICDTQGNVCVDIKGFSSREFAVPDRNHTDVSFITPVWTPADLQLNQGYSLEEQSHKVILLGAVNEELLNNIRQVLPDAIMLERIRMDGNTLSERYEIATQNVISLIREWAETGASRKILIQFVVIDNETKEYRALCGISGLLKTASMEYPSIRTQCIGWFDPMEPHTFNDLICSAASRQVRDIQYSGNTVFIKKYKVLPKERHSGSDFVLREGGTYLITGGLGGLGRIFARFIASSLTRGAVILTGRSARDTHAEDFLSSLRAQGVKAEYVQCDISDSDSVVKLFSYLKTSTSDLAGIIHTAGTLEDGYIINKTHSAIHNVLSPKVAGIVNLDEASRDFRLDFFASFSSNVSELGNPGQSDYAAANGFMDVFSTCRAEWVSTGQRYGITLSVNWPLWAEGGMGVDGDIEDQIRALGLVPLNSREGVEAFQQALRFDFNQLCVFTGDLSRVMNAFELYSDISVDTKPQAVVAPSAGSSSGNNLMNEKQLLYRIQVALIELVTEQLKVQPDDIDLNNELRDYGFDSISFTKFAGTINNKFDLGLAPTLFFEYPTLGEVSEYLCEEHGAAFANQASSDAREAPRSELVSGEPVHVNLDQTPSALNPSNPSPRDQQRVAIIGMSGSFPQADDLEQFWANLLNGVDCITEIPSNRWDWRAIYGDPKSGSGKTNVKWGGFIHGVDRFDPLFFGISPREADSMDPQQRLLMTHAWRALEDSGYAPSSLGGSDTAVLIGTAPSGYGNLLVQTHQPGEGYAATGISGSVGPNRISYLLDLHGPSEPIETACSSSLVAIHRGAELIRRGEVNMAIVGGVNTIVSPDLHISYSRAGMLCEDGRCKTFSDKANGYVRGEGVGVLVLKSLEQAEADGDHIYGVILGSAENHGGRANSLTAPNPNAQADLIKAVHRQAGIDPGTVTYIEAHGTGTELGDPIEINALKKAVSELHEERGSSPSTTPDCGIGSVKSNIGHLELAAGVAGVIKTLLQMKHKTLVKSLHTDSINQYIKLEQSPFYILQENRAWDVPKGENGEIVPRRAGVSSFGFGGVNAHLLLEEYTSQESDKKELNSSGLVVYPIVLSARSEQQVIQVAGNLLDFLKAHSLDDLDLARLSFTLQVGRDAMEVRIATVVSDIEGLKKKLESVCTDQPAYVSWYKGTVKQSGVHPATFNSDQARQEAVSDWVSQKKYEPILELWVQGFHFDWSRIYSEIPKPKRMSLPTYPFEEQRYWVKEDRNFIDLHEDYTVLAKKAPQLHPLIQQNVSDLQEVAFSSYFDGSEFILADHKVNGNSTLPGVAYLEMAREAVVRAGGVAQAGHVALTGVVWLRPAVVTDHPLTLRTRIRSLDNDELGYEIYALSGSEELVYCKGNGRLMEASSAIKAQRLDVTQLLASCSLQQVSGDAIYSAYSKQGLHYGPAYRAVVEVNCGMDDRGFPQAVAKLSCPEALLPAFSEYGLHPSVIDSALQATLGMSLSYASETQTQQGPGVPHALDSVRIYSPTPGEAYAWIRYSEGSGPDHPVRKLDICVIDADGHICAELNGLSSRAFKERFIGSAPHLLYSSEWVPTPLKSIEHAKQSDAHIFVIGDVHNDQKSQLEQVMRTSQLKYILVEGTSSDQQYMDVAQKLFTAIKPLVSMKTLTRTLIQVVIVNVPETAGACIAGVSGILKTAALENPNLQIQCVEIAHELEADELVDIVTGNASDQTAIEVRYIGGERHVKQWFEIPATMPEPQHGPIWKDGGIYLITGGLGKLGLIFARDIAMNVDNATIILCGRSPISAENQTKLDYLSGSGVRVDYQCVDIASYEAVERLVNRIENTYGTLTGVIHSAGIIKDRLIINKPVEELENVLMPKVSGIVNLDQATSTHPLEYFICFSSLSAELGNPGQSDYAAANSFMDKYSMYRNNLVRVGKRMGRTISINWPLWEEGGMQVDERSLSRLKNMGVSLLGTEDGLTAFNQCITSSKPNVLVYIGDPARLVQAFTGAAGQNAVVASVDTAAERVSNNSSFAEKTLKYSRELVSKGLKIPIDRLDVDIQLERYGMDSIMAMSVIDELEQVFGPLSKTLFFEVQTIRDLAAYFMDQHHSVLNSRFGVDGKTNMGSDPTPMPTALFKRESEKPKQSSHARSTDVAIIGMIGRYPKARNVREFWSNLESGKDCVSEIPAERWNLNDYFDADKDSLGTSYCNWGGFIEDVDQFDPQFFSITPREAKLMDPQQRLFLEGVWELLEGSGITQSKIESQYERRVGVYVGSMYQMYQADHADIAANAVTSVSSYNMIANRVSYYFGFEGPSVAVDNMCASSSMAIHLACKALEEGEARLAIAGGVNLSIHPNKYIALSQMQLLASHPGSRSFSDGDGYLPSEAVGAVLLKPLSEAIKDGDNIMAVIKSCSSMHGGRSNGFMAPSFKTQVNVIEDCLERAGLVPDDIGYIEAAANGAALGDAVELNAMAKVFRNTEHLIPMGTVKSNIGHPEAASGIAQLTKVVLQFANNKITPMVQVGQINHNLDLEKLPFRLTSELETWPSGSEHDRLQPDSSPRRALINSIGAGGSYVSLVVEDYTGNRKAASASAEFEPQLIVLSAKDDAALHRMAENAVHYLSENKEVFLPDLAYTLQLGRNELPVRLTFTVSSVDEAKASLVSYLGGAPSHETLGQTLYTGNAETDFAQLEALVTGRRGEEFIRALVSDRDLDRIAALWVKGCRIDWKDLHEHSQRTIIPFPAYPFESSRYWHSEGPGSKKPPKQSSVSVPQVNNKAETRSADFVTYLVDYFAELAGMATEQIPANKDIHALGIDSLAWLKLQRKVEKDFGIQLLSTEILKHTTINGLAKCLGDKLSSRTAEESIVSALDNLPVEPVYSEIEMKKKMLEDFKNGNIEIEELKKTLRS